MSKQISITDKKYNPKKTLHIYMRVSTKVQSEDGTSLDTQKEIGIKRSKTLGMDYVIHNEGGKSSYKDDLSNRSVMRKLLDGMEKGVIKNLYVYNTDRLSRKRTTWYLIRLKIEKCKVKLYIGEGSKVDTTDKLENLMMGILSEISQYENENSHCIKLIKQKRQ